MELLVHLVQAEHLVKMDHQVQVAKQVMRVLPVHQEAVV